MITSMKSTRILSIIAIAGLILTGCGQPKGELTGIGSTAKFNEASPYGMVYIKRGSFMMGSNSQTAIFDTPDNLLTVTVDAFWMDETEITNDEYKQFVNWVRDSIAYKALIDAGRTEFALQQGDEVDEEDVRINWKKKIPWNSKEEDVQEALYTMYYEDGVELNTTLLHYEYTWIDYDQASLASNRFDVSRGVYPPNAIARVDTSWVDEDGIIRDSTLERPLKQAKDLTSRRIIGVYPDTLIWVRDFKFAYNEPLLRMYFSHPGYAYYPVVGVTWEQAEAFCHWRTNLFNNNNQIEGQDYRLPTEAEWEYASRGGRKMAAYPWGGNYARDDKGCFMANFKPYRGSYTDDTGGMTMKVASFKPNDYGLFDMAGNVAEWTSSAYNATSNNWIHDFNPSFQYTAKKDDPDILKRKVIRGGSWKDISYFMQCGTRTYEYQYECRPYIGFRCVRSYIGEGI